MKGRTAETFLALLCMLSSCGLAAKSGQSRPGGK